VVVVSVVRHSDSFFDELEFGMADRSEKFGSDLLFFGLYVGNNKSKKPVSLTGKFVHCGRYSLVCHLQCTHPWLPGNQLHKLRQRVGQNISASHRHVVTALGIEFR
jgi:hypothetical protein